MNRRQLLAQAAAVPGALLAAQMPAFSQSRGKDVFAYVGCRTTKERNARGLGLKVFRITGAGEVWTELQLLAGLDNPSFLAFDRTQRYLYAVHGDLSDVSAFAVNPQTGQLTFLNTQPTGGKNPVHLVADPSNRFLAVANYAAGTLVSLPILGEQGLGPIQETVTLTGTAGPHKTQQGSSHPHHLAYDRQGQFILVPDKGLDRVFAYQLDARQGQFIPAPAGPMVSRDGAGPRHIDFHPTLPFAYVVNELDSTVTSCSYDASRGELVPKQIIPTVPGSYTGNSTGAEIAVHKSGRYVFVSNRGHDSVAVFKVDELNGTLRASSWTSTLGKGPRFFGVHPAGNTLYAANENSDTIVAMRFDAVRGTFAPPRVVAATGSPVCIAFRQVG